MSSPLKYDERGAIALLGAVLNYHSLWGELEGHLRDRLGGRSGKQREEQGEGGK